MTTKKLLITLGVIGAGIFVYYKYFRGPKSLEAKTSKAKATPATNMQPAYVKKGEAVSASTYKIITSKNSNMYYTKAKLDKNNLLTFKSSKAGYFTRKVLQQGNNLWAEIQIA